MTLGTASASTTLTSTLIRILTARIRHIPTEPATSPITGTTTPWPDTVPSGGLITFRLTGIRSLMAPGSGIRDSDMPGFRLIPGDGCHSTTAIGSLLTTTDGA